MLLRGDVVEWTVIPEFSAPGGLKRRLDAVLTERDLSLCLNPSNLSTAFIVEEEEVVPDFESRDQIRDPVVVPEHSPVETAATVPNRRVELVRALGLKARIPRRGAPSTRPSEVAVRERRISKAAGDLARHAQCV